MKAAVHHRFGGPEVVHIEDVPTPVPRNDEVLIRIRATTVSAADHRSRARDLPRGLGFLAPVALGVFRPRHPILGMDLAGVIEQVGKDVTRFAPGDEVIAFPGPRYGGHAQFIALPEKAAIARKPANMDFEEAVTLVFGGHPALAYLEPIGLRPGARVLVNGGAGAVGTAAIQVAAAMGAIVTAVCREADAALCRSLGAERTIDYVREDFTQSGELYDVVMDCVGNAGFARSEHAIAPGGALALVVTDLADMMNAGRNKRRSGKQIVLLDVVPAAEKLATLTELAEQGKFRAVIDRVLPLAQIADAHRYVDGGHKKGNVVIRVD